MELKIVRSDNALTHLVLAGKLDVDGERSIGDQFRDLIASSNTSFLVDMSGVSYLASLGIRLLFSGAKTLSEHGNKLVVLSPQPMVEEMLLNSGTVKFIPIAHNDTEAAQLISGL